MSIGVELQGIGDQVARTIIENMASRFTGEAQINIIANGERGSRKNAMIAAVQAAMGRSPWYANKEALQGIRFALRGLSSNDFNVRMKALESIADILIASIRGNVERQQNSDGSSFKPLTTAYARRKQRKLGFILPILRATGDLLNGLTPQILSGGMGVRANRQ